MLVLSRHVDESIIVDTPVGRVTITLIAIRGDKCRIGIDAPTELPVHRLEVANRIDRDKANGIVGGWRPGREGSR